MSKPKAPIFFTSHADVAQLGACATIKGTVTGQVVDEADVGRWSSLSDETAVILVANHLRAKLSIPQLGAIIAHEQGHINNGHLEKAAEMVNAAGIIDQLSFELEADAAAVAEYGKEVVRDALTLTVEAIVDHLIEIDVVPVENRDDAMEFCNSAMAPRMAALAA